MIQYKIISLQISLKKLLKRLFFSCQTAWARGNIASMNRAAYAFFYFYAFPTPLVEEGKRCTH